MLKDRSLDLELPATGIVAASLSHSRTGLGTGPAGRGTQWYHRTELATATGGSRDQDSGSRSATIMSALRLLGPGVGKS